MADEVKVQCVVNNVHTSKGKLKEGMVATLPAEEAKFLAGRKQAEIVREKAAIVKGRSK